MSDLGLDTPNEYTGEKVSDQLASEGFTKAKPRISTPEEAAKLAPGTTFIGPDEKERVVPYKVRHPEDVANIPDGAEFTGPDGKLRTKPKYEGIDFTAQTLYDMGVNDKERKKALERSYPGKVRDDPSGGFYVDDDGVSRKPGRGLSKITGGVASAAAPTILSVLGALGGGAVGGAGGSVIPGAGTVAGGTAGVAAGGAGGAVLGQGFNDLIMGLAGTYDRTRGEEAAELGIAVAGGMAGAGVGRGIATVVPSVRSGLSALTAAAPGAARSFLGASKEGLEQASSLAEKGVAVPPSAWAKEAPHLQNVVEVFDPAFHTNQPLLESATAHYEKSAGEILQTLGIKDPGSLTKPIEAVPTKEAGEAVMRKTLGELAESDAKMQAALAAKKATLVGEAPVEGLHPDVAAKVEEDFVANKGVNTNAVRDRARAIEQHFGKEQAEKYEQEYKRRVDAAVAERQGRGPRVQQEVAQRESVLRAAEEARTAAQKVIDAGYRDIEDDIKVGMKVANAGHNSGDLWGAVGQKLVAVRRAVGERATVMYDAADQAAGGHLPNIEGLPHQAEQFLEQLPPDFQTKYPDIVRKLRDLAGTKDPKTGEFIKEPVNPTFGQLHNMRSQMRSNVNYSDLTPDIREGVYKFFAGKVDSILHDADAVPELLEASKLLKQADAFYAENIKLFNAQQVKAVMRGLEAGEPADPANLYNVVVKSGQTELTQKIKEKVGPNLWAGVKAADMTAMLDASKTLTPDVIDGRAFAKQVLDRVRNNTLEVVHGKEASEKLVEQARRIEMLAGRLDIPVRAGDTVTQVLARARQAEELAKAAAKHDPLGALGKEMKKVEIEHKREMAKAAQERRKDPLGFLYNPTTGASEAVDKILGSEDLILAAAAKFGEQSPEFEMLRQVWAQRLLSGGMRPGEELAKVSPEVQQIMFPGVTLNQARTLAKEMDFLLDTRSGSRGAAQGMAAMAKVEHPWGTGIGGKVVGSAAKLVPGSSAAARSALGAYYGTMRKIMTSPALLRWLEKGLNGSKEDREAVRATISAVLQKGGAVGAGAGEAAVQESGPPQ